ncbi:ornithine carbamoyltransferase [Metabacillus sp. GX 13764]|uniref:ornithine carbamoyltransferase n=1 Tax=Metabacillus kandeliae TaxID=2900151 RepID=UPI001E5D7429|nr:ornithine carbamoyltransferase [Metabacillus kandeliae]MCD7034954.1 ornithine carbamoyltransferase [Metabacillus kandeliae]
MSIPAPILNNQSLKGKDFLTLLDITSENLKELISTAVLLKKDRVQPLLKNKILGMIFEKSSTRTRVSFEAGMIQLGGSALFLSTKDLQLGRGESVADTARVLSSYLDAIMIRTYDQKMLEELAFHSSVPVINGLTDQFHPCQALADMMTIYEAKKTFSGIKAAYIGDGNNVAHSFMIACAKLGIDYSFAGPEGFFPDPEVVKEAQKEAKKTGAVIELTEDPKKAAAHADFIYTDVWTSMGQEEEAGKRHAIFTPYQINSELFSGAKTDSFFLHCLPAHRGEEVTAEIMDGSRSLVFQQAENRLHAQKALLTHLLQ